MTSKRSTEKSSSRRGEATRQKIIDAALAVIAREGVRAITHRVVAKEAAVSLGSTTYYFSDIDDLISSSFESWREHATSLVIPAGQKTLASITRLQNAGDIDADALVALLVKNTQHFLRLQLNDRDNRLIEFAFYQEAVYNPRINKLVHENRKRERQVLLEVFEQLGSSDAKADAELLASLFHEFERLALMDEKPAHTARRHKMVLTRFFSQYVKAGL